MASAFSSWETDPFFAAAEDVQQSADRMESAYRNWIHKRAFAEETSAEQRNVNLCNDDVATALDTTKWQLEEFAKAVTESDTLLLGEDAAKRHFSFIEAIRNQIVLIEDALHKFIDAPLPNSSHSVKFHGEERDQLEMFLSGNAAIDQRAREVKQHDSSLTSSKAHVPIPKMKMPNVMGLMCSHYDAQGFGTSSSSNECFADIRKREHSNTCLEIIEADTEPVEKLIGTQILQDNMVSSGHTVVHSVQPENAVGDSFSRGKKPPSGRNGFRRWKSGSLCIDVEEDATLWRKDKPQPDMEMGYSPEEDSRSHHRQNYLQSTGRWRLQRLLVSRYMAVCNSYGQRALFVVVFLCLCCMYFWFLSSLVPYMNTVFPHSF